MPTYRFRLVPQDGIEDVQLRFSDDDTALAKAKETFRDVLADPARVNEPAATGLEVIREDGTVVGLVTTEDS